MSKAIITANLFLKKEGAYEQFIYNFDKNFQPILFKEHELNLIRHSFSWGVVKDCVNFWLDIDKKWCKLQEDCVIKLAEALNNKIITLEEI